MTDPAGPWRDDVETTARLPGPSRSLRGSCLVCGAAFHQQGRGTYCSSACRQVAYRWRRSAARRAAPERHPLLAVVYECPECEQRYLDERRCPECNLFCRRIGIGGGCPSCEEVVALTDLEQPGPAATPPADAAIETIS